MAPAIDIRAARLLGIRPRCKGGGSLHELVDGVKKQLTFADLERLRLEPAHTRAQFAQLINVSERTLARFADDSKSHVDAAVAERALRLARIQVLAEYVLEERIAKPTPRSRPFGCWRGRRFRARPRPKAVSPGGS